MSEVSNAISQQLVQNMRITSHMIITSINRHEIFTYMIIPWFDSDEGDVVSMKAGRKSRDVHTEVKIQYMIFMRTDT